MTFNGNEDLYIGTERNVEKTGTAEALLKQSTDIIKEKCFVALSKCKNGRET